MLWRWGHCPKGVGAVLVEGVAVRRCVTPRVMAGRAVYIAQQLCGEGGTGGQRSLVTRRDPDHDISPLGCANDTS